MHRHRGSARWEGGSCPRYPVQEIPHLSPCKGRLVRSVQIFTRITDVEIGAIVLQKMPLSLRFTKGDLQVTCLILKERASAVKRWHELHDKGAAVVDEQMRKVDEAKELVNAAFDEEERRREADRTAWRTCRAIPTQTGSGSPTTWPVWPVWLSPLVIWKHYAGGGGSGGGSGGGGGNGGGESDAAWRNCAVRGAGWSSVGSSTSRSRS
jgi:hypothetical protein